MCNKMYISIRYLIASTLENLKEVEIEQATKSHHRILYEGMHHWMHCEIKWKSNQKQHQRQRHFESTRRISSSTGVDPHNGGCKVS